ncbi:MAG: hypothetical protein ACLUFF_00105 [Acutalibacteraceae bacterium]
MGVSIFIQNGRVSLSPFFLYAFGRMFSFFISAPPVLVFLFPVFSKNTGPKNFDPVFPCFSLRLPLLLAASALVAAHPAFFKIPFQSFFDTAYPFNSKTTKAIEIQAWKKVPSAICVRSFACFLFLRSYYINGGDFLQYPNLHSLLSHSRSTRQYFISLPVAMQLRLHEQDAFIHSAEQLRTFVYAFRRP